MSEVRKRDERDLLYLLDNAPEVKAGKYKRRVEMRPDDASCIFHSKGLCFYLKWSNFGMKCKKDCKGFVEE